MLKIGWGTDAAGVAGHVQYISGTGKYKNKHKKEKITVSESLKNHQKQALFLSEFFETLEPDRSRGQRASKRKALKIIISWLSDDEGAQMGFLEAFMRENFAGHLWTWARHEKQTKSGEVCAHFHLLICPRALNGSFNSIGPRDIRKLQASYLKHSQSRGLKTGWNTSNLKPKPKSFTFSKSEKRRKKNPASKVCRPRRSF